MGSMGDTQHGPMGWMLDPLKTQNHLKKLRKIWCVQGTGRRNARCECKYTDGDVTITSAPGEFSGAGEW